MLDITPLDLDGWAARTAARAETPVLLRRLIGGRRVELTRLDFPAFESTNDSGFDGQVAAKGADPWTPNGSSVWELSCQAASGLTTKANKDFAKRTDQLAPRTRKARTFVFATPRRWPGKKDWVEAKRALRLWKDVIAYDADDLSAWLGHCPAASAWMSARLGRSISDVCGPEDLWGEWAGATMPPLPFEVFAEALSENRDRLGAYMTAAPSGLPLTIRADTSLEAAAFAAGALLEGKLTALGGDRAVVVRTTAGLQQVKVLDEPMIVVVQGRGVEAALGDLASRAHVIIASDKAAPPMEGAVTIEPLTWEAFHKTLGAMSLDAKRADTLDRESGRRPTIIRRRLATAASVREPTWARDGVDAQALAGLALVGAWNWSMPGDRAALVAVSGLTEAEVEQAIQRLATVADAPIYKVGEVGGLVSRPDAFTALRGRVTATQLNRFFEHARHVLGAPDPSLELPKEQRWAANVYGKTREVSGRLIRNIAETVAFLAVSGADVFGVQNACDCAAAAERLVRDLLAPEAPGGWMAVRQVLPALAEAAPEAFLSAIERDLPGEAEDAGVWQLIKPVDSANFGEENLRTGLLWGLERLAWHPARFARVASILAGLAARSLKDNWVNRPSSSLYTCLHPWLAQTAAPVEARVAVLKALIGRYPTVAWDLALTIADQRFGHGHYAARPDYREDAHGHGQTPTPSGPAFLAAAVDILLDRPDRSLAQMVELLEKAPCFPTNVLPRFWKTIETWAGTASDEDRGVLREKLRQTVMRTRRRKGVSTETGPSPTTRRLYGALQPRSLIQRHKWLFRSWVEFGGAELETDDFDFDQREAHVRGLRAAALSEIWSAEGLEGVIALAQAVDEPYVVGILVVELLPDCAPDDLIEVLRRPALDDWTARRSFVGGVLEAIPGDARADLIQRHMLAWADGNDHRLDLLRCAPLSHELFVLLEGLDSSEREAFWSLSSQLFHPSQGGEVEKVVEALLDAGRPTAALRQLQVNDPATLPTAMLLGLLHDVATVQPPAHDQGQVDAYAFQKIFEAIDQHADADPDTLVGLEWVYVEALTHSKRGLKAISADLAGNPRVLVQAIEGLYTPADEGDAPQSPPAVSPEIRQRNASHWYSVLHTVRRPPAGDETGQIDPDALVHWLEDAAAQLDDLGLRERGDYYVGEILGRTARETDGVWPPTAIGLALEPWLSDAMAHGLLLGILNTRGVHGASRGAEERRLAARYRRWAQGFVIDAPRLYRALESVAESYDHDAEREERRAQLERLAPA